MTNLLNKLYWIPNTAREYHDKQPLDSFEVTVVATLNKGEDVECFTYDRETGEYYCTCVMPDDFDCIDEVRSFARGYSDWWVTRDGEKPYHWFNRFENWLDMKTGNGVPFGTVEEEE